LSRRDLSEAEWRLLEPLLPPERGRKNRSAFDNRRIVNGILWRIRTGAVARSAREVRQADDGLSALPTIERCRHIWEARSPRPLPRRWPTTPATVWIRRRLAVMPRLPAQKGDSRTSFWPFAGRVHL